MSCVKNIRSFDYFDNAFNKLKVLQIEWRASPVALVPMQIDSTSKSTSTASVCFHGNARLRNETKVDICSESAVVWFDAKRHD